MYFITSKDCGIHAREWVTPATCVFIIHQVTHIIIYIIIINQEKIILIYLYLKAYY